MIDVCVAKVFLFFIYFKRNYKKIIYKDKLKCDYNHNLVRTYKL